MNQNPLERKRNQKVEDFIEGNKKSLDEIFDGETEKEIDDIIFRINRIPDEKVKFDKNKVIEGLRANIGIKDKAEFISKSLKALEPLVEFMKKYPKEFEDLEREISLNNDGHIKLSEVLFADSSKEEINEISIHLPPSMELIEEKGMENFRNEIEKGLKKLTEIVNNNPDITIIKATSWIVARTPRIVEDLGFTIEGDLSEEEKKKSSEFKNEKRTVGKAFMTREDLLNKYGGK
jgi:hypothetical protein